MTAKCYEGNMAYDFGGARRIQRHEHRVSGLLRRGRTEEFIVAMWYGIIATKALKTGMAATSGR